MKPLLAMQIDGHWNNDKSGKRKRKEMRAKENGDHLIETNMEE